MTIGVLIGSSALLSSMAIANTKGTHTESISHRQSGEKVEITSKSKREREGRFPTGAWVVESVGAVLSGVGFVMIGLGYGSITRRDQLYKQSQQGQKIEARDIRSFEDTGIALATAGWISAGIGLAAMVTGVVWLFVHRRPYSEVSLPNEKKAPVSLVPPVPTSAILLLP